jgi:hypothetical protein
VASTEHAAVSSKLSPVSAPSVPAPTQLSYAKAAGSSGTSGPTEADVALQKLIDADASIRMHNDALMDAVSWQSAVAVCIARVTDELSRVSVEPPAEPSEGSPVFTCSCTSAPDLVHACGEGILWYQSECGEPAVCDTLTMRAMAERFGPKHDAWPAALSLQITQLETGRLNDKFRSKYPFLWHLPVRRTSLTSTALCLFPHVSLCGVWQLGSVVHACEADFSGGGLALDMSSTPLRYGYRLVLLCVRGYDVSCVWQRCRDKA